MSITCNYSNCITLSGSNSNWLSWKNERFSCTNDIWQQNRNLSPLQSCIVWNSRKSIHTFYTLKSLEKEEKPFHFVLYEIQHLIV